MSHLTGNREIATRCPSHRWWGIRTAVPRKQPSLSGVTSTSKTPPPVRTLFSRLKRGPNRGRERTSLCLSYSAGSDTSPDHGLPIERGVGRWNRGVSGVLPSRKDSGTRFRAGNLSRCGLPQSETAVQPRSGSLGVRGATSPAARAFSGPFAADRTSHRRDRAEGGLRRPWNVLSGHPQTLLLFSDGDPQGGPQSPLDTSGCRLYLAVCPDGTNAGRTFQNKNMERDTHAAGRRNL